jgi:serine/threonine protein kinase
MFNSYPFRQLSRLESLHEQSYIHRDVKPSSFMTGMGEKGSQVFLIDFGLAQLFRNPLTRQHLPQMSGLKTVGTIAFTSISSHLGQTQSRRDDLEALVYTIIYLYRGRLPWQDDLVGDSVGKRGAAVLKKKIASAETLCLGLPAPFHTFAQYIRSLNFDQKPQYSYLHTLLTQCLSSSAPDSVHFASFGKSSSPSSDRM